MVKSGGRRYVLGRIDARSEFRVTSTNPPAPTQAAHHNSVARGMALRSLSNCKLGRGLNFTVAAAKDGGHNETLFSVTEWNPQHHSS